LFQSIRYRLWWWLPTVFTCGIVEIIGWAGRAWGSQNPWSLNPYLMQICCTIFAPSFMTAAMFIIFVRIIMIVGPEYSRLTPKIYSYLFVGVDLVALVIQSIGGAQAASASTPQGSSNGAHIMVGGIIVQMAAITAYALTSVEYFWRVSRGRPIRGTAALSGNRFPLAGLAQPQETEDKDTPAASTAQLSGLQRLTAPVKSLIFGLTLTTVLVYVRSIYRTIELLDGWGGPIITNQTLFDCLDGVPIFLAMVTLNVFHPGRLIPAAMPATPERV